MRKLVLKCLAPFSSNSTLAAEDFLPSLLKAAASHTYVETISDKADSLHRRIEQGYAENIFAAQLQLVQQLLREYQREAVTLALDITEEDFYGETSSLWITPWTGEAGVRGHFKFLVLSLVGKQKHPLLALPLHLGYDLVDEVHQLLQQAKRLFKHIRLVLFDRGFYSAALIAYLQAQRLQYLIFVPKNKAMKRYWASGCTEVQHTLKTEGDRSKLRVTAQHVFIEHDAMQWTFVTTLACEDAQQYIWIYKQRWQIETNFRVQDEASIKSRSCNYLVRYFYFCISLLLQLLWRIFGEQQFKVFVIALHEYFFLQSFGIDYAGCM